MYLGLHDIIFAQKEGRIVSLLNTLFISAYCVMKDETNKLN